MGATSTKYVQGVFVLLVLQVMTKSIRHHDCSEPKDSCTHLLAATSNDLLSTMLLLIINVFVCRKLGWGFHMTNPAHQCPGIICMLVRFKRGVVEQITAVSDSPTMSITLAPVLLSVLPSKVFTLEP